MDRRGFLLAAAAATTTPSCALAAAKTPQMFGAVPDGVTDNTEALQKMLDAGGDIRWTPGRYRAGGLQIRSRTRIAFEPGASLTGIAGRKGVLRAANTEDVTLEGPGELFGPPEMTSHTLNLAGARRATVRGLKIGGGGADGDGNDALYIGRGTAPCRDIHIDGCTIHSARRNGVSVVECFGYVIENCELHGNTGSPGAGIDIEANRHGTLRDGVIRNNRVHGNERIGIIVAFGDDVAIHGNEVFDNGKAGIAVSAGAAQWREGVYRPEVDLMPITDIDPRTGRIRVRGAGRLEVGSIVAWRVRKGGPAKPREFARQTRFVVLENDQRGVLLSADGATPITALTPADWGRLTGNLADTSLALRAYAEGQASHIDIWRNRCRGNGGKGEIDISTSVRVRVRENEVDAGVDRTAIYAAYARRLSIVDNRLRGSPASSATSSRGIHVVTSSHLEHQGNQIQDFGYAGVFVNGVAGSYRRGEDVITNCGWLPGGAPVMISNVPG